MQQSPSSLFQRGIDWIASRARKIINVISGSQQITQSNHQILQFPNIPRHLQVARNQGLKRVRAKLGSNNTQQKVTARIKKSSAFWAYREGTKENRLQVYCPICMQYMVGPVSTLCGHTFCWECLDEAYLLSPVCPVCRLNLDRSAFLRCLELQAIIIKYYSAEYSLIRKDNDSIQETYSIRLQKFLKWLQKRILKPNNLKPSDLIDVRDTEGIWCACVIKDIIKVNQNPSVLIHYIGWSSLYDEVVQISSQRLATYKMYTNRKGLPRYEMVNGQQMQGYVIGVSESQAFDQSESEQGSFEDQLRLQILSEESEGSRSVDQQVDCISQTYRQFERGNPEQND